jgi:hypothetical protein
VQKGLYSDDYGATVIDYSMSAGDVNQFRKQPYNRMCLYLSETYKRWDIARYLARKDSVINAEFIAKQKLLGRFIDCALGRYFAHML